MESVKSKKIFVHPGWGNSAINPFLYAAYSPQFRAAFFELTIGKCIKMCERVRKCCGIKSSYGGAADSSSRATITRQRMSLGVSQEVVTHSFSGTRITMLSDANAINSDSSN